MLKIYIYQKFERVIPTASSGIKLFNKVEYVSKKTNTKQNILHFWIMPELRNKVIIQTDMDIK